MKKIIAAFAFVLMAQLGMAQDAAFKADVMKVISLSGSDAQMKIAKDQILKMVPAEKQAAFLVEFEASLPAFYDKIAGAYMETYTKDDVKEMIKFYESPVGQKITAKAGDLLQKSQAAGREWGAALQAIMMKYMQ
jgi:hypothetical protein